MISDDFEIKKPEKGEGKTFEPLPVGVYQVQVYDVNEVERNKYNSSEKEKALNFQFVVLDEKYRGRYVWKTISPVYNEGFEGGQPSWLYRLFKAVGVELSLPSPEDINNLVGKQIKVVVQHKTSKSTNNTYAVITDFLPIENELPEFEKKTEEDVKVDDIEEVDLDNIGF